MKSETTFQKYDWSGKTGNATIAHQGIIRVDA
ncbi:hypothetical protein M2374_003619 [Citrobacter sp. JUb117]|nr:hypothetical protein [Citrobacter sp. JUb117]